MQNIFVLEVQMDKTKEYISMVDCPEIQDAWVLADGDYLTTRNPEYKPECMVNVFCFNMYSNQDWWRETHKKLNIWLPKQDQLQKMVHQEFDMFSKITIFKEWCMNTIYKGGTKSMEQLWLQYIMKELHNKKWDGKVWI